MILTLLIAALAAIGICMILWGLVEALLLPVQPPAWHIIWLKEANVEQQIRGAIWLRRRRGIGGGLIFADGGLSVAGRGIAERLLQSEPEVLFCRPEEIPAYLELEMENEQFGTGTDQRNHSRSGVSESGKRIRRH